MTETALLQTSPVVERREFLRYLLVSAIALEVDVVTLMILTDLAGIDYLIANIAAFVIGSVVAYVGSIRWAFSRRRIGGSAEYVIFLVIGIVGLGINELALWAAVAGLAFPLLVAKAGAAGASFLFNFIARKILLFS
jgi:putative flippase GtrA